MPHECYLLCTILTKWRLSLLSCMRKYAASLTIQAPVETKATRCSADVGANIPIFAFLHYRCPTEQGFILRSTRIMNIIAIIIVITVIIIIIIFLIISASRFA
uniref:Uncharacterized protein n=1 Tax=Anopheles atroparvus TaxID=41427 RepID=A0A182IJQ5_ANOAO